MPSRAVCADVAVTSTIVSAMRTVTAPPACRAILPVSRVRVFPPANSTLTLDGIGFLVSVVMGTWVRPHRRQPGAAAARLLAQAQLVDQFPVTLRVLPLQIIQQAAALPDQQQQAAAGVVILGVGLEMLGKVGD